MLRIKAALASRLALRLREGSSPICCVPAPMIAHLHSAPVPANQFEPAFVAVFFGQGTRQVVAAFRAGLPGLFDGALTAHHDHAARKGEVRRQRFNGEGMDGTLFNPSMPEVGLDKKGVAFNASSAWACLKSLGWLPLIWSR